MTWMTTPHPRCALPQLAPWTPTSSFPWICQPPLSSFSLQNVYLFGLQVPLTPGLLVNIDDILQKQPSASTSEMTSSSNASILTPVIGKHSFSGIWRPLRLRRLIYGKTLPLKATSAFLATALSIVCPAATVYLGKMAPAFLPAPTDDTGAEQGKEGIASVRLHAGTGDEPGARPPTRTTTKWE